MITSVETIAASSFCLDRLLLLLSSLVLSRALSLSHRTAARDNRSSSIWWIVVSMCNFWKLDFVFFSVKKKLSLGNTVTVSCSRYEIEFPLGRLIDLSTYTFLSFSFFFLPVRTHIDLSIDSNLIFFFYSNYQNRKVARMKETKIDDFVVALMFPPCQSRWCDQRSEQQR